MRISTSTTFCWPPGTGAVMFWPMAAADGDARPMLAAKAGDWLDHLVLQRPSPPPTLAGPMYSPPCKGGGR